MKDLKNFIATTIIEYLNEESQYNKFILIPKKGVNKIRDINDDIDEILNNSIFNNKNIYLKGGVARNALELYINSDIESPIIRDIDYCYIGSISDYHKLFSDEHIDYEGSSLDAYFKSRDVTINEVLLRPDALIFTRRAYRDFNTNKINPKTIFIDSRLYSRILLFSVRYGYEIIDNIDIENIELDNFDFLVCMLKAYELGVEYKYYKICKDNNITNAPTLSKWITDLLSNVYNFNLYGREKYIAKDILINNKNITPELYERYPELIKEVEKLKKEAEKLDIEDFDFLHYMKKRNRMTKFDKKR